LTPLSLPSFLPRTFAREAPLGLPRPRPSSLREDETISTTRGAFHRRGTPTHTRGSLPESFAVTCASAMSSALGAPSLAALRAPAFAVPGALHARPPSPPIVPLRDVHAKRRRALLWVRLPPNDFCNYTIDARTHSRASDSRLSFESPASAVTPNLPSCSPGLWSLRTFPCRRRIASAASRNSPFETGRTAMQARRKARPRKLPPDRDAACGRRLDPTTVCGDGRWTTALDWTGRVALSEGSSLPPPAAAERRGRRFPSSCELLEHPYASSTLWPEGWMLPPSS